MQLPAKLAIGLDSRATISDGWDVFVETHCLFAGTECIFHFDTIGCYITIQVHIVAPPHQVHGG